MAKRTRYDEGYGVCRMRWHRGEPSEVNSPVLVEAWTPDISIEVYEPTKPHIGVRAVVEVRVFVDGKWMRVGWKGELKDIEVGSSVRRWAKMPYSRRWNATITLDGWDS